MKKLSTIIFSLTIVLTLAGAVSADTVVSVQYNKQQKMDSYGMDFERLWHWNDLSDQGSVDCANLALMNGKINHVRVAINCKGELEEGQFDPKAYKKILEVMRHMKAANPNIKFFASPRPLKEGNRGAPWTCYPLWVTKFNITNTSTNFVKLVPQKAADYLENYLNFMNSEGFTISYLDIKNECKFIKPGPCAEVVDILKQRLGSKMPTIIGGSDWSYANAKDWWQEAKSEGVQNRFDIISSHNTGSGGSPQELVNAMKGLNKPFWNTELHEWVGPDDVAVENTIHLFDIIRAGFSGMNEWLSLGSEGKEHKTLRAVDGNVVPMRNYYIYKKLVTTSAGGNYLSVNVPSGLTSTMAFIKGNTMTVWALNSSGSDLNNVTFKIDGRNIDGQIERTWWGPIGSCQRQGTVAKFAKKSDSQFQYTIKKNSLYCFKFSVGSNLRVADNPANTVRGLDYKYYEGGWSNLPDFSKLITKKTGTCTKFDITQRLRDWNFGFVFKGYVYVPADGKYTFYTKSDDGSKLYIGNKTVVNNDGKHGTEEVSGTIGLKKGKHAIKVEYFENTGGEVLEVRYKGPTKSKQLIPASALHRVKAVTSVNNLPSVSIVKPANGSIFSEGDKILIEASASDTDGTVARMDFYHDGVWIGKDTSDPFRKTWYNVPAGTHTLKVKATDNDGATRTTTINVVVSSRRLADNPANTVKGLRYKYYEGGWSTVPSFSGKTPVDMGTCAQFDISSRLRNDKFAFLFTGYIQVNTAGTYTFYTSSDDGSNLYIGDEMVVDNDGKHAEKQESGTIDLQAGKHEITVEYFDNTGDEVLKVMYKGPGLSKQTIPENVLYR